MAIKVRINYLCDIMTLRNRLERYEMRKYYGPQAAPWSQEQDERREDSFNSTQDPGDSALARDVEDFISLQVAPPTCPHPVDTFYTTSPPCN